MLLVRQALGKTDDVEKENLDDLQLDSLLEFPTRKRDRFKRSR